MNQNKTETGTISIRLISGAAFPWRKWLVIGLLLIASLQGNLWAQTFRASASAGVTSGTTPLTISKPAGTISGDLMIAAIAFRPNTETITEPSGWTLIRRTNSTTSNTSSQAIYRLVAGSSEPESYTWILNGSHTGAAGGIMTFYGIDTANPVNVQNGRETALALTHDTPSVTTTVNNTILVTAHSLSSSATWTPPGGMTEAVDVSSVAVPNAAGIALEMAYVTQASAGSTGTKTATASNDADSGVAHILALQPPVYTISGMVYADEGLTPIGAGKTVRLLINGASAGTGVTDSSGNYSIQVSFSAGDAVLVYIDDDATYRGVTASVVQAASLTGFDIYAGHVITRHDNGGILTNTNLSSAKGSYSDMDIPYSVSGGALTVGGTGTKLYVPFGHSYTPGGNVTTPSMKSLGTFNGGNSTIDVNGTLTISGGTFTASSATTYVAGNLSIASATFNNNSGAMTFDGTDATISAGTATLNNITVDKTNYSLTMGSSLTVSGNLNVTSGILNQGASYNLTTGPVTVATDGTLRNRGTGGLTLSGNVANSGKIDFNGGGDDLCGTAAKILILSSVNGAQRSWSGSGIFDMVDVDVKDQAGSANITVYGGTNSGNNGTNWTFNAGCTGAPTAVTLISFTANNHNNEIVLQWRTGHEVSNLGFHVYREEGGRLERLTPELLAGSALRTGSNVALRAGRSYMWLDSLGSQGSGVAYFLEDVDLNGKRTWYGPVMPEASPGPLPERYTPQFLSELGQKVDRQYEEYWKIQALKERVLRNRRLSAVKQTGIKVAEGLRLLPNKTKPLPSPDVAMQWTLARKGAAKILIKEEGWYRLSVAELNAAGFYPIHPRQLQLFVDGKEVPILVKSKKPGRLDPLDTIEFYGEGLDTPFTGTRVYWLVEGSHRGERISVQEGPGEQAASASFPFTVELKERIFYFAALKNGEAENFFGAMAATQPVDKILTTSHLDPVPPGDAILEVALQGVTEGPHRVKAFVNNVEVGEVVFDGQTHGSSNLAISQALLLNGENLVTLASQNGDMDVSLIDSIKLTYWRTYSADGDSLKFSAQGGWGVSVGGFTSRNIRVFDIMDPYAPSEVLGRVMAQGASYSISFGVTGLGLKTLLAFTDEKVKSPVHIVANQPSKWHKGGNGHDVVIISHRDFFSGLEPLKNLRQSQKLRVALIDVEDLYDEFSFGNKTPQAIKDFLGRAKTTWHRPPRFVLLVGDASFDPRNYLGVGDFDFVPTKLVETAYLETASDDWFVDFNGDGLPEVAMGRLPTRTTEEVSTMVSKIVGYEQSQNTGGWRNQALLVADENGEFDFEVASEAVRNLLPSHMTVRTIFKSLYGSDEQARDEFVSNMNRGVLLVNYIGHGSEEAWGVNMFTSEDSQYLMNGLKLPFVMAMTCLNGNFHDIYTESIAEAFLKAKQGGAVAIAASSGLTEPNGQAVLNKELMRLLFSNSDDPLTLGQALMQAKSVVTDPDIRRTWIFFGDPATRLRSAPPEVAKGIKDKR